MTLGVGLPGSPRLLLLLLSSHSLYYLPDQVPCLPLHPDGVGLVRIVEFEHVLNTSDLAQGTCQHLCRTLLLLALLLLLTLGLLLIALRHLDLLATRSSASSGSTPSSSCNPTSIPRTRRNQTRWYLRGSQNKFICAAGGA